MLNAEIFLFKSDISGIELPSELNNPYSLDIPKIAQIAATEFQEIIKEESKQWPGIWDEKGKMFGVLVVRLTDNSLAYIGTVSGQLPYRYKCKRFVPSVFDETTGDSFIGKGMTQLTEMGTQIKHSKDPEEIKRLKEERAQKSYGLQQRLFENYNFLNIYGEVKNVIEIFENFDKKRPPAAAGECSAPKLLNFALENKLKPIAIAEFWWGNSKKYQNKIPKAFYPACTARCKPILEYMLACKF